MRSMSVGPATRVTNLLGRVMVDGAAAGVLRPQPGDWLNETVRAELSRFSTGVFPGVPASVVARGLLAWTLLFGAITFELFGRLVNVIENRDAWFAHEVTAMSRLVGLRP